MDEDTGVRATNNETNPNENRFEIHVPEISSLFESIESFEKQPDIVLFALDSKPWWLLAIYGLVNITVEKCQVHINSMNFPIKNCSNTKQGSQR